MPTISKVKSKGHMYELLKAGAFGNTVPMYLNLTDWHKSEPTGLWGVRSLRAGSKARMNIPTDDVPAVCEQFQRDGIGYQISPMIDATCRLAIGELYDSETGWKFFGVLRPTGEWRDEMRRGKEFGFAASRLLLSYLCTPSSYADIVALLERYPAHIVEMTILEKYVGTIPGRNAVIWEVRPSDGSYEKWIQ